jgi:hypothetical protein
MAKRVFRIPKTAVWESEPLEPDNRPEALVLANDTTERKYQVDLFVFVVSSTSRRHLLKVPATFPQQYVFTLLSCPYFLL